MLVALASGLVIESAAALPWAGVSLPLRGPCSDCYMKQCEYAFSKGTNPCHTCIKTHKEDLSRPPCQLHGNCYDAAMDWCSSSRSQALSPSPRPEPSPGPNPPLASPAGNRRVGDGFGVDISIKPGFTGYGDGELELMAKAFKVLRVGIDWPVVEKDCGTYNFSLYDAIIHPLFEAGIRPYPILGYTNKCYEDSKYNCDNEKCIEAYANFSEATAQHYKQYSGLNISFSCVNEPNNPTFGGASPKGNAKLAKAGGSAFLGMGFGYSGGVMAGVDTDYAKDLIDQGILKHVTALSTHPYTHHAPEFKLESLQKIRSLMDQAGGKEIKLRLDEWAYPYDGFPSSFDEAASFVPRMWMACLAFGLNCDLGIFFNWDGVQDKLKPNALYDASATFQTTVGNAYSFDKLANVDGAAYAAGFFDQHGKSFFVWPRNGPTGNLLHSKGESLFVRSGQKRQVSVDSGERSACWAVTEYNGQVMDKVCSDSNGVVTLDVRLGIYLTSQSRLA